MGLDRLAWRTVAARPLRSFLTIVGIALGIAVLSASLALGAALDQAVDRTVRDMVGRADLRVSGFLEAGLSGDLGRCDQRRPTACSTPPRSSSTGPSRSATPGRGTADAVTVLGIDPTSYQRLHDLPIVAGTTLDGDQRSRSRSSPRSSRPRTATRSAARSPSSATGGLVELRIVGVVAGFGPHPGRRAGPSIVPDRRRTVHVRPPGRDAGRPQPCTRFAGERRAQPRGDGWPSRTSSRRRRISRAACARRRRRSRAPRHSSPRSCCSSARSSSSTRCR